MGLFGGIKKFGRSVSKGVRKGVRAVNKISRSKVGKAVIGIADKVVKTGLSSEPGGVAAYSAAGQGLKMASRLTKNPGRKFRKFQNQNMKQFK